MPRNVVTAFFGVQYHTTRTSYKFYLGRNNVAWLQGQGTDYSDQRMDTYVGHMNANFSGAGVWGIKYLHQKTNPSAAYNDQKDWCVSDPTISVDHRWNFTHFQKLTAQRADDIYSSTDPYKPDAVVTGSSLLTGFGGACLCPNGGKMWANDTGTNCESIQCTNGKAGTCRRETSSDWAYKSITCETVTPQLYVATQGQGLLAVLQNPKAANDYQHWFIWAKIFEGRKYFKGAFVSDLSYGEVFGQYYGEFRIILTLHFFSGTKGTERWIIDDTTNTENPKFEVPTNIDISTDKQYHTNPVNLFEKLQPKTKILVTTVSVDLRQKSDQEGLSFSQLADSTQL